MNLDAVKDFKVLLVGDAIYDRYVFCTALGKSIKETVISVRYEREEEYKGGVWAAANQLNDFCSQVTVVHSDKALVNTRYVEATYNRKLFTLHDSRITPNALEVDIPSYDVVIVTDFGHGTMTNKLIARLSKESRFLCVNAQTNSQNFGFNLITKYKRADFVVIDELEARLAAHDKESPIEDVILALGFKKIIVTLGAHGAVGFDGEFWREKGKTGLVVDTIGAGDAFLAIAAPFAAARFSIRDLVRIGNAAGAAKTAILGHQRSITRKDVEAYL